MKIRLASWMVAMVVLAPAVFAKAEESFATVNSARFELIKKLAGDWVEPGKDGKPGEKVVISYRVTAAGSVVEETFFPGTDREMVTMYHRDGADLILTHYCMLGNQPRMKAEAGSETNRVVFHFINGTNMKSEGDAYMSQVILKLDRSDRLQAEWSSCSEGKACHKVEFDLVKKAG